MIAFDLQCAQGHIFEGWFSSNESYEEQAAKGLVECPFCSEKSVRRVLSAVSVRKSERASGLESDGPDYQKLAMQVIDFIQKNFEDVGAGFTVEALKMHYGVAEKRNIRGSATEEEEKILTQEGVKFFKFPMPKKEEKPTN